MELTAEYVPTIHMDNSHAMAPSPEHLARGGRVETGDFGNSDKQNLLTLDRLDRTCHSFSGILSGCFGMVPWPSDVPSHPELRQGASSSWRGSAKLCKASCSCDV